MEEEEEKEEKNALPPLNGNLKNNAFFLSVYVQVCVHAHLCVYEMHMLMCMREKA